MGDRNVKTSPRPIQDLEMERVQSEAVERERARESGDAQPTGDAAAAGREGSVDESGVNKTGQDPIVEPPNSTVDDWLGQRVGRDEQRADDAMREANGDPREAERRFEQETERDPDEPVAQDAPTTHGFGESDIPDPMPQELQDVPDQTQSVDEMGGESPTG